MGKYKVKIKNSVYRETKRIPIKDALVIVRKITDLSNNPRLPGCRKLFSGNNYRIRYKNYRIIYSIKDDVLTVYVIKVGHRKHVYR